MTTSVSRYFDPLLESTQASGSKVPEQGTVALGANLSGILGARASGEHKLRARRRTRSLTTWAPTTAVTGTVADTSADPDPP